MTEKDKKTSKGVAGSGLTQKELKELIKGVIKEFTGTGAFRSPVKGGQNPRQSQRPFNNDEDEVDFYNKQNTGDGGRPVNKIKKI